MSDRRNIRVQGARLLWGCDGLDLISQDAFSKLSDEEIHELRLLALKLGRACLEERRRRHPEEDWSDDGPCTCGDLSPCINTSHR